jgi:TolA-binding protein
VTQRGRPVDSQVLEQLVRGLARHVPSPARALHTRRAVLARVHAGAPGPAARWRLVPVLAFATAAAAAVVMLVQLVYPPPAGGISPALRAAPPPPPAVAATGAAPAGGRRASRASQVPGAGAAAGAPAGGDGTPALAIAGRPATPDPAAATTRSGAAAEARRPPAGAGRSGAGEAPATAPAPPREVDARIAASAARGRQRSGRKDGDAGAGAPAPAAQEAQFAAGWRALEADNFGLAVAHLGRACRGSGAIAEDACFWRAVALARAGRGGAAAQAYYEFLGRFPAAVRAGEAHVLLGWLLLQRGATSEAQLQFAAGLRDRVDRVRAAARRGLRAVAAARSRRASRQR